MLNPAQIHCLLLIWHYKLSLVEDMRICLVLMIQRPCWSYILLKKKSVCNRNASLWWTCTKIRLWLQENVTFQIIFILEVIYTLFPHKTGKSFGVCEFYVDQSTGAALEKLISSFWLAENWQLASTSVWKNKKMLYKQLKIWGISISIMVSVYCYFTSV